MKKNWLVSVLAASFSCSVHGQSPESFRSFLESKQSDSVTVVAELAVRDQIIELSPDTRPRHRLDAGIETVVYLRKRYDATFQPHIFVRVQGNTMPLYYASRVGLGFTNRADRYSIGCLIGEYERHVLFEGDATYRNGKEYESRSLVGGYLHFDPRVITFFGSLIQEHRRVYYRAYLGCKLGDVLILPKQFRGLRIHGESEYLVGTSFGVSLQNPHLGVSLSYHIPKSQEETYQKSTAPRVQGGYSVGLSYRFF